MDLVNESIIYVALNMKNQCSDFSFFFFIFWPFEPAFYCSLIMPLISHALDRLWPLYILCSADYNGLLRCPLLVFWPGGLQSHCCIKTLKTKRFSFPMLKSSPKLHILSDHRINGFRWKQLTVFFLVWFGDRSHFFQCHISVIHLPLTYWVYRTNLKSLSAWLDKTKSRWEKN